MFIIRKYSYFGHYKNVDMENMTCREENCILFSYEILTIPLQHFFDRFSMFRNIMLAAFLPIFD